MRLTYCTIIAVLIFTGLAHAESTGDVYPLTTDPVTGTALGASPVIENINGRELRFTNAESAATFKKDSAGYLKKLDAQLIAAQLPTYAYDKCAVSDEKLGDMGEPDNIVVNNRLVRLCCAGCVDRAQEKPADVFTKLDAAVIAAQLPKYALETCVVTDKKLDKDSINFVIGSRLIRLADKEAVAEFKKDPAKYLAKIDAKK